MSESFFINEKNWTEIKRGYFYQAAMYYLSDTEQPLRFLEEIDNNLYTMEKKNGNFDPIVVDGKPRAVEQNIVITVKPRQVIVLSNDILNKSTKFKYVQVAPVLGLYEHNTTQKWYDDLINDKLEGFAYIADSRYGVEVDLTQISTIHKSMLLHRQRQVLPERMNFIDSQILDVLDL